jgi:hypothetical protein
MKEIKPGNVKDERAISGAVTATVSIADPWTERNRTQKGREQATKEIYDKKMTQEAIRRGLITKQQAIKTGLIPKPREDTGYEKSKPFWENNF